MPRLNTRPATPTQDRPFHPLADMFPLLEGEEFDELVADIKTHGLREPITMYEDSILDGRNRYRACQTAGVEPTYAAPFSGNHADAVAFVISANIRRRHLTPGQKLALITKLLKLDPSKSDRAVAKTAGVSDKTVAKTRRSNAEIPHKPNRTEASGRKARGRKPATNHKSDTTPRPPPPPIAAKAAAKPKVASSGKPAAPPPCSFCNRGNAEVRHLIIGLYGHCICNECVDQCVAIIREKDSAGSHSAVADQAVEHTMPPELAPIQGDDPDAMPDFLDRSHKLN